MRLESGLYIGREALITHGTALASIANNVSNSNTVGYKSERAEFGEIFTNSQGSLYSEPLQSGNGTKVEDITISQAQGSLEQTDRELDFGILGKGFFVLNDGVTTSYTRAGNFSVSKEGNLVNSTGKNVMGFTTASPTTPVALQVSDVAASPSAATAISVSGNLDSSTDLVNEVPANPGSFEALNKLSTFSTPISVVDSLGKAHDVGLQFFHTTGLGWTVQAYVDSPEVGGTQTGVPALIGTGTLTFDSNGAQATTPATTLTLNAAWSNGAAASSTAIDLSKFTGFATTSTVNSLLSDGVQSGSVTGVGIDTNGLLSARLSNGDITPIGTVALATFVNPGALERSGDNQYVATTDAGEVKLGAPNLEGRGIVKSQSLESSTVDISNEFINLVRYQRGYQAGSQVITTVSDLVKQTIGIA